MSINDRLTSPQQIPDAKLPVYGVPGSRFTTFLRATPPIFTVLLPGYGNSDVRIRAYSSPEYPQRLLYSRFILPLEVVTTLKELVAAISGTGTVTANLSHTHSLAASVLGFATVSADLLLDDEFVPEVVRPESLRSLRRRRRVWKEWQV